MESSSSCTSDSDYNSDCNCSECLLERYGEPPSCPKINKGPSRHYEVDFVEKKLFFEHFHPDGCRKSYRPKHKPKAREKPRVGIDRSRNHKIGNVDNDCCFRYRSKPPERRLPAYDPQLHGEICPRHGYRTEPARPRVPEYCEQDPSPRVSTWRKHRDVPARAPIPSRHAQADTAKARPETRPLYGRRQVREPVPEYHQESYIDRERRYRATPAVIVNHMHENYAQVEPSYEEGSTETDIALLARRTREWNKKSYSKADRYEQRRSGAQRQTYNSYSQTVPQLVGRETVYAEKNYVTELHESPGENYHEQTKTRLQITTGSVMNEKREISTTRKKDGYYSQGHAYRSRLEKYIPEVQPSKRRPAPAQLSPPRKPMPAFTTASKPVKPKSDPTKITEEERAELNESLKREVKEFYTPPASNQSSMTYLRNLRVVKEMVPKWDKRNERVQEDEEASRKALLQQRKQAPRQETKVEIKQKTGGSADRKAVELSIKLADVNRSSEKSTEIEKMSTKSTDVERVPEKPTKVKSIRTSPDHHTSETRLASSSLKSHKLSPPTLEDATNSGDEIKVIVSPKTEHETPKGSLGSSEEIQPGSTQVPEADQDFVTPVQSDTEAGGSDRAEMITPGSGKSVTKEYKCDSENHSNPNVEKTLGSQKETVTNTTKEYKRESHYEASNQRTIEKQGKCESEKPGHSVVGRTGKHKNRRPKPAPASIPDGLHPVSQKCSLVETSKVSKNPFVKDPIPKPAPVPKDQSEMKEQTFWGKLWFTPPESNIQIGTEPEPELKPLSPPGSSFESEIGSDSSHFAMVVERSAGGNKSTEETLRRLSADYDNIVKGSGKPESLDIQNSKLQFNRSYSALKRASHHAIKNTERLETVTSEPTPEKRIDKWKKDNGTAPEAETGFALRCHQCKLPIQNSEAPDTISTLGRSWHARCFKCSVCATPLSLRNHAVHESLLYCMVHFAEKINAPRCKACNQYILDRVYTQTKGSNVWHKNCFRCSQCNEPIVDAKFVALKNGKIVCLSCHKKIYSRICETCGKLIKPTDIYLHLKSSDHYWHATPECLKCANCQQSLVGRQRVFFKNTKTYCNMACARKDTVIPKA